LNDAPAISRPPLQPIKTTGAPEPAHVFRFPSKSPSHRSLGAYFLYPSRAPALCSPVRITQFQEIVFVL
jgi:hypothetical protein